jgi:plasmid maintenance system antidote protein VapI
VKTELLLLILLWAVTLNGFSVAVNARGPVRVTLSYLFAIFCLCGAVFTTIQEVVSEKAAAASIIEAPAIPEPPPPEIVKPAEVDTVGLRASQLAAALGAARNEITQVIEQARRLGDRLAAVNLGRVPDLSDEEYDAMQNKAFGFRNEIGKVKDKVATVGANLPEPLKPVEAKLQEAVQALSQAVQAYDRFFKAENDEEESVRQQAFRRSTQEALSALKQAESGLSSP